LNAERRKGHLELKNEGRTTRSFAPGDIAIVKQQVKSRDSNPAKQMIATGGPYQILKSTENQGSYYLQLKSTENQGSYYLQRSPFLQGLGKKGKRVKESTARMEKLPSVAQR
jgi:hypothetical protein